MKASKSKLEKHKTQTSCRQKSTKNEKKKKKCYDLKL
jgi:hypothetical protein